MFTRETAPIKGNRYIGKFGVAVMILALVGTYVQSVVADTDLPAVHQDIILAMAAEATPPPEPPAPPPADTPKPAQPDVLKPDAAPPEAPEGVKPEPPKRPDGPIGTPPDKICVNCVPGGDTNIKRIFGDPPPLPPPPPAPEPQKPIRVSESQAPKQIKRVNPSYPTIAQSARVEGIVILEATIDTHGNVVNVTVLRGQALLNEAAVNAVQQWKYEPHRLNGQAIPVIMTVTVNFTLKEPA